MKTILLSLSLIIAINAQGQNKGDNTIAVHSVRTIKEIKQVLFNNGYTIDGSDTSFFLTTPKQMKNASVLKLMFARFDTSTVIKGQAKIQVEMVILNTPIKNEFEEVVCVKSKSNLNYAWFAEMNKIALLLGNDITYLKQ